MKTLFLNIFLFLVYCPKYCFSQTDTIPKHFLGANIAAAVLSGELGFYYEYAFHPSLQLTTSYGHRFWQFSIIENGRSGGDFKYLAQQADILRLGIKKQISRAKYRLATKYVVFQTSYWNMRSPKYTTRDGSNGLNDIRRDVISVNRKMFNGSIGFGMCTYQSEHFYSDAFIMLGVSTGNKSTHYYSWGWGGNDNDYDYPPDTIEKDKTLLPTIDIGYCLGFGW
ncbi:MAG TPA: hypothetical protein VFW78_06635 [Bacteroidia bacterium]|nr:hypothetical protein [Bacteroidia bacterium]